MKRPGPGMWLVGVALVTVFGWSAPAWAAAESAAQPPWVLVLLAASLLPFVLVTITSYAKIAVVLHILRTALGAPGVPPTIVITALAIVLSGYVMAPTAVAVHGAVGQQLKTESTSAAKPAPTGQQAAPDNWSRWIDAARAGAAPVKQFLHRNSTSGDRKTFADLAQQRARAAGRAEIPQQKDLAVVLPAFVVGQLRAAFQIGFLLFIPFLVLDLLVANVLLALGLHAVTPASIALPLKLLLFVAVDGWTLLARGLVLSYN